MYFEARRAFWVLLPQKADPLFLYTLRPLDQTDRPRFWLSPNPRWVNPIFHSQLPVSHRCLDNINYVIAGISGYLFYFRVFSGISGITGYVRYFRVFLGLPIYTRGIF